METHRFTPSRPGGSVCVAVRFPEDELCGYPSAHPIHHGIVPDVVGAPAARSIHGHGAAAAEVMDAAREWARAQTGTRAAREVAYHRLMRAVRALDAATPGEIGHTR